MTGGRLTTKKATALHLRLPPEVAARVKGLAAARLWTESETLRALVQLGIEAWEERGPPPRPVLTLPPGARSLEE